MASGVGPDRVGGAVRSYFHVYASGPRWRGIVADHVAALAASGVAWDLVVGIVGDEAAAAAVLFPDAVRVETWDDGFEQRTLNLMYDDLENGFEGPVLYAHTKGAAYSSVASEPWRRCMTGRLVRDAKVCLDLLDLGATTVGCHWLDPAEHPHIGNRPYYAGNFWWSHSDHLRLLDRPGTENRYDAEAWVATVAPSNPVNLVAGWPGTGCRDHT